MKYIPRVEDGVLMYTDLLLDNTKIEQVIKKYFEINYNNIKVLPDVKPNTNNFTETRYNVEFDDKKLFLSVFINSKGKTSLKVKEGKLQDEKAKLADFIIKECKLADENQKNKSMLFKNIDFSDFEETLELIREEELCTSLIKDKDDKKEVIYKLKCKYNDIVTVTYNKSTSNVRIQGLPLLLYNLCVSYINELVEVDDVVSNLEKNFNQNVSSSTVEEQFKLYLPNSHDKHTEKLKKSLLRAVYNLNINSQEYTCTDLVFEVLRALEGHIKITLNRDYEITSSKVYGNLDMFKYDYDNEIASIKSQAKRKIKSKNDKVNYYEKAYKHIIIYRHKYFHWDFPDEFGNDGTVQIDDIDDAKNLIRDTLKIIDEYYKV